MSTEQKKQVSRQRMAQIRNREAGKCMYHASRDSVCKTGLCQECREKSREKSRKRIGGTANKLQAEDWAKVDFSYGPSETGKRLGVSSGVVWEQIKKRGWRKIYVGPTQMVIEKVEYERLLQTSDKQEDSV